MKSMTEKQEYVFSYLLYKKLTLKELSIRTNMSPTQLYPIVEGLSKKGFATYKWNGHSFASIITSKKDKPFADNLYIIYKNVKFNISYI